MQYISGKTVKIGDVVLIDHGKTKGTVEHIIDTDTGLIEWNMKPDGDFGLIISADRFGLVFWQIADPHDPIIFIERAKNRFPR